MKPKRCISSTQQIEEHKIVILIDIRITFTHCFPIKYVIGIVYKVLDITRLPTCLISSYEYFLIYDNGYYIMNIITVTWQKDRICSKVVGVQTTDTHYH